MTLKPNSAYYIEVNGLNGTSDLDDYASVGKIVRKDYWYPERGDGLPYADMHENSFTAHVGMANREVGKSAMAVTLDGMKQSKGLSLRYESWGTLTGGDDRVLGVKIDYRKADGSWQAGKLYALEGFRGNAVAPLGSKTAASEVVSMGDLCGEYEIGFADAPADWDGRIAISYLIKDAGKGATAKFILREKQ